MNTIGPSILVCLNRGIVLIFIACALKSPFGTKFKKVRYKINNWPKYNEALKTRGSITLWLSDDVITARYVNKNKLMYRAILNCTGC